MCWISFLNNKKMLLDNFIDKTFTNIFVLHSITFVKMQIGYSFSNYSNCLTDSTFPLYAKLKLLECKGIQHCILCPSHHYNNCYRCVRWKIINFYDHLRPRWLEVENVTWKSSFPEPPKKVRFIWFDMSNQFGNCRKVFFPNWMLWFWNHNIKLRKKTFRQFQN